MRNLASLWRELFAVAIAVVGLEIIWRDQGRQELAGEPMSGTIGAELQEMAETA